MLPSAVIETLPTYPVAFSPVGYILAFATVETLPNAVVPKTPVGDTFTIG